MQAVLMETPGGADVLRYSSVPEPQLPGPEYLKVRLHAAGINPVDYKMRSRGGLFPERLPAVLGCDGAGVVVERGAAVTRFAVGDEVYFFNGGLGGAEPGNYAEYTVVREDCAARKPAKLSMPEAAALPLAAITAWESLFDRTGLQSGESVLIHAGAGGVGHIAVQLAKEHGARVAVTVGSAKNAEFARSLGADHCINYQEEDFVQAALAWSEGEGVDVVMDNVGGDIFRRSFGAAKIYGKVVTLLEAPCDEAAVKLAKQRNLCLCYELMLTPMLLNRPAWRQAQTRILERCADLADAGRLRVHVSREFPLEQAADAHRLIEQGHVRGKLVLRMDV